MRRFAISAAFTAVLLVFVSSPVAAGLQWCPRDPIISLNGQEVQIWVAIPEQYQTAVTGPIRVDVRTPGGVRQAVLFTDEGFNGFGEQVTFFERGQLRGNTMSVAVRVLVPYDRSLIDNRDLPILLTVVLPDGSVVEVEDGQGIAKVEFEIPAHP
jgi:hypothetical protein